MVWFLVFIAIVICFFLIRVAQGLGLVMSIVVLLVLFWILPEFGKAHNPVPTNLFGTAEIIKKSIEYDPTEYNSDSMGKYHIVIEVESHYNDDHSIALVCYMIYGSVKLWFVEEVNLKPAHLSSQFFNFGKYYLVPTTKFVIKLIPKNLDIDYMKERIVECKMGDDVAAAAKEWNVDLRKVRKL